MTIGVERGKWWWARQWRDWGVFPVVAVVAVMAVVAFAAVDVQVTLVAFFVCLAAVKMWGDNRWRRGWRVWYSVAFFIFLLVALAADFSGYVFALVGVPEGMARAAVERREEKRAESLFAAVAFGARKLGMTFDEVEERRRLETGEIWIDELRAMSDKLYERQRLQPCCAVPLARDGDQLHARR